MSITPEARLVIEAVAQGRITLQEAESLAAMNPSAEQVRAYLATKSQAGSSSQTDGMRLEQQWER